MYGALVLAAAQLAGSLSAGAQASADQKTAAKVSAIRDGAQMRKQAHEDMTRNQQQAFSDLLNTYRGALA